MHCFYFVPQFCVTKYLVVNSPHATIQSKCCALNKLSLKCYCYLWTGLFAGQIHPSLIINWDTLILPSAILYQEVSLDITLWGEEELLSAGSGSENPVLGQGFPIQQLLSRTHHMSAARARRRRRRVKLGHCASLLAPSSTTDWVSCNEEVANARARGGTESLFL